MESDLLSVVSGSTRTVHVHIDKITTVQSIKGINCSRSGGCPFPGQVPNPGHPGNSS